MRDSSQSVISDIVVALHSSAIHQYQSCWQSLQTFLRTKAIMFMSQHTLFEYLSYLFHTLERSVTMVACHLAVIEDPFRIAFCFAFDSCLKALFQRGLFLQRPPPRAAGLRWSLHWVLAWLEMLDMNESLTTMNAFWKALFLNALASDLCICQLKALTHFPAVFRQSLELVSLALSPTHMTKNDWEDYHLVSGVMPSFLEVGGVHPLCLVAALHKYIQLNFNAFANSLSIWPRSNCPCSASTLALLLRKVIMEADPTSRPRTYEVWKVASKLAFLQTRSLSRVRELGQWHLSESSIHRYLVCDVSNETCVALVTHP